MHSSECPLEPPSRVALEVQDPFQNDPVLEHDELEDLGLPEITKERIKLQRSLFEEKHRMYMFEKNYLQSAALYCHGNILAGLALVHDNMNVTGSTKAPMLAWNMHQFLQDTDISLGHRKGQPHPDSAFLTPA